MHCRKLKPNSILFGGAADCAPSGRGGRRGEAAAQFAWMMPMRLVSWVFDFPTRPMAPSLIRSSLASCVGRCKAPACLIWTSLANFEYLAGVRQRHVCQVQRLLSAVLNHIWRLLSILQSNKCWTMFIYLRHYRSRPPM